MDSSVAWKCPPLQTGRSGFLPASILVKVHHLVSHPGLDPAFCLPKVLTVMGSDYSENRGLDIELNVSDLRAFDPRWTRW